MNDNDKKFFSQLHAYKIYNNCKHEQKIPFKKDNNVEEMLNIYEKINGIENTEMDEKQIKFMKNISNYYRPTEKIQYILFLNN